MDSTLAHKLHIPLKPLPHHITVHALNGQKLPAISHITEDITLITPGNHSQSTTISIHILDSPLAPIVLCHPWLLLHNPKIDWSSNSILSWSVCCREFSISLPQNIQALSGSCVIIKCRFEIQKQYEKDLTEKAATGLWLKDGVKIDTHLVFNSKDTKPNHLNGKITGKLHEKNCTTIFYNVSSKHTDSPPKPTVQLYVDQKKVKDQEEVLEVLEGSSVSLHCSAETLCSSPPPTLTWSSTPRIPLSESSRREELISDLNFTATHRQHRVTFTCTITYQLQHQNKTAQDNITVHVQYSPKNTSVSVLPSSSVLEGSSVTLICSSEANPAVNYTWSRESEGQMKQLKTGDTLTFARIDLKHRGLYYCTAQNQHGTQNSPVMLDIQYAPKNTSVSVLPSSSVLEGSSVTLTCSSEANPAVNYTWSRESEGQMKQLQTGDTLTFGRIDLKQRGWYHCTAQNQHGTQNSSVMLDIQYAPKNTSVSVLPSSSVLEGSSVTLTCSSEANPAVNYTWSRESEGQMEQLQTGDTLTFGRIDLKHRGWYYCTAQNQHGTQNSSVMLDIQYCQQVTVSFLIILSLILVHFALTVGLALHKIRQLSSKLKVGLHRLIVDKVMQHEDDDDDDGVEECFCFQAQNEAAGTYSSLQLSAPSAEYDTLNIMGSDTINNK
ncbi:B-cell receptor CD22-like [Carassius auratus]|uniref:B-cell receptor CD22-like n=1 Tax=Carassius auratus TaxID=7957 RepID=A0A6P6JY79_CARAU|nr:B-cell receptor CD22-like [Carassius auratus]